LSVKKAAEHVAYESSTGTWTTIHTEKPYMKRLAAKVFSIRGNCIKIAYPIDLFELDNIPEILSSVAGNIFGMKVLDALRLEDISLPKTVINRYKGPKYGIAGVRKLLKVRKRPLLGTIVKPKLGLKTNDHARVCYDAWIGGCDLVKDDENLSSQKFNPFEKRVLQTLKMRDKAEKETGERKMYMPNVTAETKEMIRRAEFVKNNGGKYMMVDVITCGWSAIQTLRNMDLNLVLHGHRAMHAAFTRGKDFGISMLTIAKMCRLIGMDQLHIGTVVGKMEGGYEEVHEIEEEIEKGFVKKGDHVLAQKWYSIKPMFPVCSGGLAPKHVPRLVKLLGKNIIIQMGGGIHHYGTKKGAKMAREAVNKFA